MAAPERGRLRVHHPNRAGSAGFHAARSRRRQRSASRITRHPPVPHYDRNRPRAANRHASRSDGPARARRRSSPAAPRSKSSSQFRQHGPRSAYGQRVGAAHGRSNLGHHERRSLRQHDFGSLRQQQSPARRLQLGQRGNQRSTAGSGHRLGNAARLAVSLQQSAEHRSIRHAKQPAA